jgi:hypothetical protein
MLSTLFVDTLEIGVPKQACAMRKGSTASPLPRFLIGFCRHTGGHRASRLLENAFAIAADADRGVRATLLAKSWFHRDPFAPLGAAAG